MNLCFKDIAFNNNFQNVFHFECCSWLSLSLIGLKCMRMTRKCAIISVTTTHVANTNMQEKIHHVHNNADVSHQLLSPKNNLMLIVNDGMPKNMTNDIHSMIFDDSDDIDNSNL